MSLEHGHVRTALTAATVVGAVGVFFAIPRGARALILRALAWTALVIALVAGLVWMVYRPLPNQIPLGDYLWISVGVCAAVGAGMLVRRRPGTGRALVAALAGAVAALAAAGQVNAQVGTFPTVGSLIGHRSPSTVVPIAFGEVAGRDSHIQYGIPVDSVWKSPMNMPDAGVVTNADIPGTVSGFSARPAVLYLPPAYLASPRATLPVMVMIAGQPGGPEDWFTSGRLATTVDAYAARHDGLAPVVVVVDALGSNDANPLCLDSALGNAASYLARDVPAWIKNTLQVSENPAQWAIGGFSYGGTCSIQLSVNYPEVYPNFLDFLGQDEPSLGNRSETVAATFAGDEFAFEAVNPVDVLKRQQFPQLAGVFVAGAEDEEYRPQQQRIFAAAKAAGLNARYYELPGGHEGATWSAALEQEMDWVGHQLGLTG